MRISVRIASSGKMWYPKWPKNDLPACYPKDENGIERFNEAEARRQLRDQSNVMIGSGDSSVVIAFGAILIASVNDWLDDCNKNKGEEKYRRIGAKIGKKIDTDHVSFVRVDITNTAIEWNGKMIRTVKVKITHDDKWTPQAQAYDEDFAMVIADFCRCYAERWVERGDPPLVLADETQQLIADLHERTRLAELVELNAKRTECERYRGGYCAPCKFDCPCYHNGKCEECEIK